VGEKDRFMGSGATNVKYVKIRVPQVFPISVGCFGAAGN